MKLIYGLILWNSKEKNSDKNNKIHTQKDIPKWDVFLLTIKLLCFI